MKQNGEPSKQCKTKQRKQGLHGFVALRNTYAESGKGEELLENYGLTSAEIVTAVDQVLARKHVP